MVEAQWTKVKVRCRLGAQGSFVRIGEMGKSLPLMTLSGLEEEARGLSSWQLADVGHCP